MRARAIFAGVGFVLGSILIAASPLRAATRCVPVAYAGACDSRHATIQDAVDQSAPSGDIVLVAAGTYPEHVIVSGKSLQLLGAQAGVDARGRTGPESVLVHPDGPLTLCGNEVAVDGFTLTGATSFDGAWAGLTLDQGLCGATGGARVENNIIRDNIVGIIAQEGGAGVKVIRANWIKDNSVLPEYGVGIESDWAPANLSIESNLFSGNPAGSIDLYAQSSGTSIVDNRFDRPIRLVLATSVHVERNVSTSGATADGLIVLAGGGNFVVVTRNTLRGTTGRAIVIDDSSSVGPNHSLTVQENCIEGAGLVGLDVTPEGYSGLLTATDDWWGSASGPSGAGTGSGAAFSDPAHYAIFTPFRTDPALCDVCITMPSSCDDGNTCTVDSCNSTTGQCEHVPISCNDFNACTDDSCNPATGACVFAPRSCDDANPCTIDSCSQATGCSHAPTCDDGDACTIDTCNSTTGACTHMPRSCDDGEACSADSCDPRTGCVHVAPGCDDANPCTIDTCSQSTGCVHLPACDDGDACTIDTCAPITGACTHTPRNCNDGIACTADSCSPSTGCVHVSLCDDGNPCTQEACSRASGACVSTPRNCDDGNPCTDNTCNPATGACTNPPRSCDDGNACTVDSCSQSSGCSHTTTCNDGNPCTDESCNPATGACVSTPRNCDDANPCTIDSCVTSTGQCSHAPVCDDHDACTTDTCDSITGACTHTPRTSCDDANPCTTDSCVASTGQCSHVPACDDHDICTGDVCDSTTGVCTHPQQINCDDGNVCTADHCDPTSGGCSHSSACDDGNECTDDSCDAATGACTHTVDDTNSCGADRCLIHVCSAGVCVPTSTASGCNDGIGCTTDACDTATGACTHTPNDSACGPHDPYCERRYCLPQFAGDASGCIHVYLGENQPCDDHNPCTQGDRCYGPGACGAGFPMQCGSNEYCTGGSCVSYCTDGNPCTVDAVVNGSCTNTPLGAPGEVTLTAFKSSSGASTLSWSGLNRTETGLVYDVANGAVQQLPIGSGAGDTCQPVGPATSYSVPEIPVIGAPTWYLVRARDICGVGTYGYAQLGVGAPLVRVPACP